MRTAILLVALLVSAVGLVEPRGTVGIGTDPIQQMEMIREWVQEDVVFYLEGVKVETMVGMPAKIVEYNVKSQFSDKCITYSPVDRKEAERVYLELSSIWYNSSFEERASIIIDWEVQL